METVWLVFALWGLTMLTGIWAALDRIADEMQTEDEDDDVD